MVASSGTSLTQDQIKLIYRFTKNITVLYDGDSAGIKASFRGIDMLLENGLNVRVVLFPDNHDPDSFSRSRSGEETASYLADNAVDFIRFKTQLLLKEVGGDPIKRAELIENIVSSIALIPEDIYRVVYIQECSSILHIDEADLVSRLNKIFRTQYHNKLKQRDVIAEPKEISTSANDIDVSSLLGASIDRVKQQEIKDLEKIKDEVLENSLLRLLLSFGRENTTQIFIDAEGKEVEEIVNVGIYIVREMDEDELMLDDPISCKILDIYRDNLKRNYIPTMEDLLQIEDTTIKKRIVDVCYIENEVSQVWKEKNIFIKAETEPCKLNQIVLQTVVNFKLRKLEKLDLELDEQIKLTENEDESMKLLEQKKDYCRVKMILSEKIRRILV